MSLPFLLEIGTEEIPDWMIDGARQQLAELFDQLSMSKGIGAGTSKQERERAWVEATPRRIALYSEYVNERQADLHRTVSGPPRSAAKAAVEGFARRYGVSRDQLGTQVTAKGEYYCFAERVLGRATCDVLAESLPEVILNIQWPKAMYWTAKNGSRFIRPIRWIVALLGDEVIPFEIAGVMSGNVTSGHRILGAAQIPVTIANYKSELEKNFVILSANDRAKRIRRGVGAVQDEGLLQTLVYLTEYPTVISGSFDPEYLKLPAEVLVTVMRHHQKYFAVYENGQLANRFFAVTNTDGDPEGIIRQGNERVLRARFNDARFFWDTDQHKQLADRVADLAHVTFQAKLGTYLEKTARVEALARELEECPSALRAAHLSKADLTTEMVKEFTELQGVVGGLYAREQGEPEEVWQAIYDHYKPVSMEDSIPRNRAGQLVSIADKLDTVTSCFAIGLIPSGSKDPFALRRAAQGIVKILVEGKLRFGLKKLLTNNAQGPKLEEFFLDRIRYYFKDIRGFKYDEVNAVLASGWDDLVDVEERLVAIQAVRPTENFEPLAASFKRIQNILKQAQFTGNGGAIDPALLEPGPEVDLYTEFQDVRSRAANQPYRPALELIASLRPKVDLFFDKVLVNAPDAKIRQNRLTLLHTLLAEFSTIADFSEIVTNG